MVAPDMDNSVKGHGQTAHTAQGLPNAVCHITGHNREGKSVFLSADTNAHHPEPVYKSTIANFIDQKEQYPVELNDETNTNYAYKNKFCPTLESGSVCRIIDLAPDEVSQIHRFNGLEYAIVIEGVLNMILDSGEERIIERGDIVIERSTTHRWVNVTKDGVSSARILVVQLDTGVTQRSVEKMQNELCVLGTDHVSGRGVNRYGNDFFESEF
ncbi:hypothetical protein OPT61_g8087 [Boeremia exigua]|uniref:Uncharacterized protein n=1 Tax=Boeremia exigua TaxID=749465 RepID=A0ACC2HZM6_9PLEO|nr:hypothetical protein OPT61_g8087 [Boeremia exigua]